MGGEAISSLNQNTTIKERHTVALFWRKKKKRRIKLTGILFLLSHRS